MAYTDYLTGLPNRARLMAALASARARAADRAMPACVLLLDLDGFKTVNDVAGHEAGDLLLGPGRRPAARRRSATATWSAGSAATSSPSSSPGTASTRPPRSPSGSSPTCSTVRPAADRGPR